MCDKEVGECTDWADHQSAANYKDARCVAHKARRSALIPIQAEQKSNNPVPARPPAVRPLQPAPLQIPRLPQWQQQQAPCPPQPAQRQQQIPRPPQWQQQQTPQPPQLTQRQQQTTPQTLQPQLQGLSTNLAHCPSFPSSGGGSTPHGVMARMRSLHNRCLHAALCAASLQEEGQKLFEDMRAIVKGPLPPEIEGAISCQQDAALSMRTSCEAVRELAQFIELRAQCTPMRTRMLKAVEASSTAAARACLYGQTPSQAAGARTENADTMAGKKRGREEDGDGAK